MNREVHVRFWERLGVKLPWATRQGSRYNTRVAGSKALRADARHADVRARVDLAVAGYGLGPSPTSAP
jgi:hypothetical protein